MGSASCSMIIVDVGAVDVAGLVVDGADDLNGHSAFQWPFRPHARQLLCMMRSCSDLR